MISAQETTQRANNWGAQVLQNCCLMEEMRYASEQLRKAMSRLPADVSLEGICANLEVEA